MIFHNGRGSGPRPAGGEQRGAGAPYLVWNPVPAAALRPPWMPEPAEHWLGARAAIPAVQHSWGQKSQPICARPAPLPACTVTRRPGERNDEASEYIFPKDESWKGPPR